MMKYCTIKAFSYRVIELYSISVFAESLLESGCYESANSSTLAMNYLRA